MPAQTETRSGLLFGWGYGENGWNTGMDANLLRIGRFGFHLSVKDRDLTEPPAAPDTGDTYIVGGASTGDWTSQDGRIAIWAGAQWVFAAPRHGWVAYIEDEEVLSAFKPSGWSVGISI